MGLVGRDAEMAKLDLRLGPGQGHGAVVGRGLMMPVRQIEGFAPRRRDHGPIGHTDRHSRRDQDAVAQAEDRVEHRAGRIGERPVGIHGLRRAQPKAAPDEACPVGLELHLAHRLALDHGEMGGPDLGFLGRAAPAGRQ